MRNWFLTALVSLITAISLYLYQSQSWRFLARAATYPKNPITDVAWYKTRATVNGNKFVSLTSSITPVISKQIFSKAADYVHQTHNSQLVVLHKGLLVHESYGNNISSDDLSNSMSMAKTIVSLLVGIAVSEGQLDSIDDPVSKYLPAWKDNTERARISLRNLLEMSSGLRCDKDTTDYTSDLIQLHLGTNIRNLTIDLPSKEPPGTKWEYNNFNTQTLAWVLEKVTNLPLNEYASRKLWQQIGAKEAFFWADKSNGTVRGYCCFFARARDFAKLGQLVLNRGKWNGKTIVPEQWIKEISSASTHEPEYGLHIWRASRSGTRRAKDRSEEFIDEKLVYFDGKHRQRIYISPKHDLVIVRTGEHPKTWDDSLLPNLIASEL
ncbi:MAG: serine hydrolase [Myxococcota bacterium]|nr:serine hydrolase [Myxococcota bacterium]